LMLNAENSYPRGYTRGGGFAEFALVDASYAFKLEGNEDAVAAPLMCAELITFAWSLVPATVGNLMGGGGLVSAVYWFIYRGTASPAGEGTSPAQRAEKRNAVTTAGTTSQRLSTVGPRTTPAKANVDAFASRVLRCPIPFQVRRGADRCIRDAPPASARSPPSRRRCGATRVAARVTVLSVEHQRHVFRSRP